MQHVCWIVAALFVFASAAFSQGAGGLEGGNQIMHKQGLHQYIVLEAFKILEQAAPHRAAKLRNHIGTMSDPFAPWLDQTISAGSNREDEEDILYGYGGKYTEWDPDIDMLFPTSSCVSEIHTQIEGRMRDNADFRTGFISTTHFWEPDAVDKWLYSEYTVNAYGVLACLEGSYDSALVNLRIKPMYSAWDKAATLLGSTMQTPIRDFWTTSNQSFYNPGLNAYLSIPDPKPDGGYLLLGYSSLAHLYNTGECFMAYHDQASGAPAWPATPYVLTNAQRDRYVWEILGRICHLLEDMSVPAHTKKDVHPPNQLVNFPWPYPWLVLGGISYFMLDADSYEQWIANAGNGQDGDLSNVYWNADLVIAANPNEPFIDPSNQPDPLYYLMNEMRSRAAAFASSDFDGDGTVDPNQVSDFHFAHWTNLTDAGELALLQTIRDATIPYCIRAVAGLLYWFADQLIMPEEFLVINTGVEHPDDFGYRPDASGDYLWLTSPYAFDQQSSYPKSVGDDMFLYSHFTLFQGPTQISKFFSWSSDQHAPTAIHQSDFIVMPENGNFNALYRKAETSNGPHIAVWFERGALNLTSEIMFRNPWLVNPANSIGNLCTQFDQFLPYSTSPLAQGIFDLSTTNNGGHFLEAGDPNQLKSPYYSLGLPYVYDDNMTPQTGYARGDWLLEGMWTDENALLLDDPLGEENGLDPVYYDSKAVIFDDPDSWVWGNYKGHLLSAEPSSTAASECALCPNSQRKLDWIDAQSGFVNPARGIDELVYESMGNIWYTCSENHGDSWRKELAIDAGERPSIVSAWDAPYVVYNRDSKVYFGRVVNSTWWEGLGEFSSSNEASPVIATDDYLGTKLFAWEAPGGTLSYCQWNSNGTNSVVANVHSSNPTYAAIFPTIAHKYGSQAYHLAWREGPDIYYKRIEVGTGITWPPEIISNYCQPAQGAPTITVDDNDEAAVAWAATMPGLSETFINFRQNSPGGWGGFASILLDPSNDYWAPSLSNVTGTQPVPSLRIAHNINHAGTGVMQLVNGNWTVPSLPQPASDGLHPSLVDIAPSPDQLQAFTLPWAPYAGTLWGLWFTDDHLTKSTKRGYSLASSREVILTKDTNRVVYRVGEFIVHAGNVQDTVDWSSGMDSLIVGVNKPVHRYIETSAVTVPSNGLLKFRTASDRKGSMSTVLPVVFALEIVDAVTDSVLAKPHSIAANAMGNGHQDANITIPLQQFSGQDVRFRFRLEGRDSSIGLITNNYYYYPDKSIPKIEAEPGMQPADAARATLDGNYPNPFNPSTEISYHLQEDMDIRLVICDARGREISVLREGRENAGSHIVSFDCSKCESGVYVYRLETPYGNLSRKMVMIK